MNFDDVIQQLSAAKPIATFTPNEDTGTSSRTPYGYYEIKNSLLGPVMLEVSYVDNDGDASDAIHIKVQNTGPTEHACMYAFKELNKPAYKKGLGLVKSLPTVSSRLTRYEGDARWFHFCDSLQDRVALNKHYLNARVMYDTMSDMIRAPERMCFNVNNGYIIQAVFDNRDVEIMQIKQITQYNNYGLPVKIIYIALPCVGLADKFVERKSHTEMMMFEQVKNFIDRKTNSKIENFTRWDDAYINTMAKIRQSRQKAR